MTGRGSTCAHSRTGIVSDVDPARWGNGEGEEYPILSVSTCWREPCVKHAIRRVQGEAARPAAYYDDALRAARRVVAAAAERGNVEWSIAWAEAYIADYAEDEKREPGEPSSIGRAEREQVRRFAERWHRNVERVAV